MLPGTENRVRKEDKVQTNEQYYGHYHIAKGYQSPAKLIRSQQNVVCCAGVMPADGKSGRFQKTSGRIDQNIRIGADLEPVLWFLKSVPVIWHQEHGANMKDYKDIWKVYREEVREKKRLVMAERANLQPMSTSLTDEDVEIVARNQLLQKKQESGKVQLFMHRVDQTTTPMRVDDQGRIIAFRCAQIMDDDKAIIYGWPHARSYLPAFSFLDLSKRAPAIR